MADSPEIVVVKDVSKRFVIRKDNSLKERVVTLGRAGKRHREEFWALRNVSMTIQAGTTVGLIGHNGSGKSTLLKVLGGILDPTTGTVARRGRIAALLELGAGFHPDLTGRENVFLNASILGLSREVTEARFPEILSFSGIGDFIDTQVKFYSSGMYVRLAFAVAVHTDPDLLLVDEVLAVGDEAFQRKCMDKIRSFQEEGRTIVLVTHSLGQVADLCDRAILLNQGEVVFDGDPRQAVVNFRNILEGRRIAEEEVAPVQAHVERDAQIVSASAHAVNRRPDEMLQTGDDLVLSVEVEHLTDTDEAWDCAIQIDSAQGQAVYATSTQLLGEQLRPSKGPRWVQFILKDTRFGAGKYFVSVSIMHKSGVHIADLPQACSFDVAYTPLAIGTVYAAPEFSDLGSLK
ncbi:ABC transporter ATP-binding protein [Cryobacterium luteum]|uniref:ABC transporter ATP-binding protein n=1 Tax=Cryobacterium luteum TaxID=1424661 RepID=A0A1H8CLE8_9MICO|nr:ABC transporter ATP-binding protein [Cryobacterium luteum]TFB89392.1 ABC transporter ATP-binding protein [Cryobacterium luteum]SEM94907.1 ABC-2 type transport system ATP-binding protein [Cryobacterium luteum]